MLMAYSDERSTFVVKQRLARFILSEREIYFCLTDRESGSMHLEQYALSEIFALTFAVRKELISAIGVLRGVPAMRIFAPGAGFEADFNLVVQVAMGVVLIAGALLARAKRYTAHGICQTTVLVLNLAMIAYVMWPSFYSEVLPVVPNHLTDSYYGVASAHGLVAVSAELFGLYLLLVAATDILPDYLCVRRLRLWMRVELGLWWIGIVSGVLTYYVWYAGVP
jgi:uncharacterized membrane protein YozB (DUF420 family)